MFFDVSLSVINNSLPRRRKVIHPLASVIQRLKNDRVIKILLTYSDTIEDFSRIFEVAKLIDKWVVSSHFFEVGLISKEEFFSLGAQSKKQAKYIHFFHKQIGVAEWRELMNPLRDQFPLFFTLCFDVSANVFENEIERDIRLGRLNRALHSIKYLFNRYEECEEYFDLFTLFIDTWVINPSSLQDYYDAQSCLKDLLAACPELLMRALTDGKADLDNRLQFFKHFMIELDVRNEKGATLLEYAVNICDQDLLIALSEQGCHLTNIQWRLLDEAAFLEVIRRMGYLIYHFDREDALEGCALGQESWQWRFVLEKGLFKSALGAIEKFDVNLCGHELYNTLVHEVLDSWHKLGMNYSDSQVRHQILSLEENGNMSKRKCDAALHASKRHKVSLKLSKYKRTSGQDRNPKKPCVNHGLESN